MSGLRLLGIPIRAHPVLVLMLILGLVTGMGAHIPALMLSLCAHELCHALAALGCKVRVRELELMPFGGAARIDGLWTLRPAQVICVALAGPAANLLIALGCSALAWSGLITPYIAFVWLRINLVLMLFNLLPALPLDGGRVFCALISTRCGQARSLRLGISLGRVLAILLLSWAVWMFWQHRQINLSLLLCALYLFTSAEGERRAGEGAVLVSLLSRQSELADEGALPVRWLGVTSTALVCDVVRLLRPRCLHRIAVYDSKLRFAGVLDESCLISALQNSAQLEVGALLHKNP